ncbi:MAG: hypothetical protein L0Y71_26065 [Gemmataceae bacterium]|nr:hypothetical protein [Gemmataceae bacterium]
MSIASTLSAKQADLVRAIVAARAGANRAVAYDKLRRDHARGSSAELELRRTLTDLTEAGIATFSGPDRLPETVALTRVLGEKVAQELPSAPQAAAPIDEHAVDEVEEAARREWAEHEAKERSRQAQNEALDREAARQQAMIDSIEREQALAYPNEEEYGV